jgi:hypothetical protein
MTSAHACIGAGVGLGAKAPDAELTNEAGGAVFLSSYWQNEPLVLVLIADLAIETSVDHILTLRDAYQTFDEAGGDIAVVVRNTPAEIAAFRSQHNVAYPVLSDPSGATRRAYSTPPVGPASFVIDTSGVIRYARRANGALDTPSTWELVDAVCGLTGEAVERPEPTKLTPAPISLHNDTVERPAFVTGAPVKAAAQVNYTCSKCGNTAYEIVKVATSGGWISRIFNFQYRNFVAVVCTACNYSDLYRTKGGSLANVADIIFGQ